MKTAISTIAEYDDGYVGSLMTSGEVVLYKAGAPSRIVSLTTAEYNCLVKELGEPTRYRPLVDFVQALKKKDGR